jgi:hypothetical protein
MYGADFEDRLAKADLDSCRLEPQQVLGDRLVELFRLVADETVWLVRRESGRRKYASDDALRLRTLPSLTEWFLDTDARLSDVENRAAQAQALAARWEREYLRLRNRLVIRVMAAVARPVRRLRAGRT